MKTSLYALTLAAAAAGLTTTAAAPAAAQSRADEQRWQDAQRRFERERIYFERERERYEEARRYGYNRGYDDNRGYGDNRYGDDESRYATDYDAARYYREDPRYQERVLSSNDEVFRGSDGRYYCRRSDGTTGLIIGGATGGILGNVIDGGRSRGVGTLIGGALGALLGREAQRQQVRCR